MSASLLLDTHILIRLMTDPGRLSREQTRVLEDATARQEMLAVSAISLVELAASMSERNRRRDTPPRRLLEQLDVSDQLEVLPITIEVAKEMVAMGDSLRDPGDRAIVATARIYGHRLVTSDERIIESRLVPVVV